jgi:sRNA-binding protein
LGVYCSNEGYLRALAKKGAVRVGLDGQPCAFVSDEDAVSAKALIEQARGTPRLRSGGAPSPAEAQTVADRRSRRRRSS